MDNTETTSQAAADAPKGKSIIDPKYKDKYKTPDWLAQTLIDNASVTKEVVSKVVGSNNEITDQTITKSVPVGVDVDKLFAIGRENGLNLDKYEAQRGSHGFAGRFRMTVRNMLQAVVKQRHGMVVNGEFIQAPTDFLQAHGAPESPTHNKDGSKIAVAKTPFPAKEPAKEAHPVAAEETAEAPAKMDAKTKAALDANVNKGKTGKKK